MVSDGNFGNATLGELAVEDQLSASFSATRMYGTSNGFLVSGQKGGVAAIARISLIGELLGFILLPELKSISKVVIGTDDAIYVSGMGQNDKFRLEKYQSNGLPVSNFNGSGFISDSFFSNAVSIQDFLVESQGTITILTRTRSGLEGEKLGLVRLLETTSTAPQTMSSSPALLAYPNPASDQLFWRSSDYHNPEVVTILDAQGKTILPAQPSNGEAGIRIETLTPGMYWLSIEGNKNRKVVSFLKK
jgi:hypothetical protein